MSSEALNRQFVYIPKSALIASVILHLCVPLCFVVFAVLDRAGLITFRKRLDTKTVYQSFIQVDVVGLPDQLANEKRDTTLPIVDTAKAASDAAEAQKEEEAAKAEDEMAEKRLEQQKAKEAKKQEKLRQAEEQKEKAMKQLQEEANREAALKALGKSKQGKAGRTKIAGNKLSKGTALTGNIGDAKDRYSALVYAAIKEHFNIFPWQNRKGLVAVIHIELYPNGRVRQRLVARPSTDAQFNSTVLQAVDTATFPTPDDPSVVQGGIDIEFRP